MSSTPNEFDTFVGDIPRMWSNENPQRLKELERVTVPTTVVQSGYDEAIRRIHSEEIATAIPNADYLLLGGVSHFALFQDPQRYAAAIRFAIQAGLFQGFVAP